MNARRSWWLLAGLFVGSLGARAGEPVRPAADELEAPLPPEAVARFGSTRFRGSGLSQLCLSLDGKKVMARFHDGGGVFDIATGKLLFRTAGNTQPSTRHRS